MHPLGHARGHVGRYSPRDWQPLPSSPALGALPLTIRVGEFVAAAAGASPPPPALPRGRLSGRMRQVRLLTSDWFDQLLV